MSESGCMDCGQCGACIELTRAHAIDSEMAELRRGCGADRIKAERIRQNEDEGWSAAHDDTHRNGQLALAAACYAAPPGTHLRVLTWREKKGNPYGEFTAKDPWPWDRVWDKRPAPSCSRRARIRALEKAGALVAAEIDRLLGLEARSHVA